MVGLPHGSILDLGAISKVKRVILDPQRFLSYKEAGISKVIRQFLVLLLT
jgi:hypothetical protein